MTKPNQIKSRFLGAVTSLSKTYSQKVHEKVSKTGYLEAQFRLKK
jgi:hypothetical protein